MPLFFNLSLAKSYGHNIDKIAKSHIMPIDSIILAGGRSQRMGKPKALLEINEIPLITHIVNELSKACDILFIAASINETAIRKAVVGTTGIQFVDDHYPTNEGPLSGIISALAISSAEFLWVTTVDSFGSLTHIKHDMLKALQAHRADIVFLQDEQRDYPLQAIIKTSRRQSLMNYIASGRRSVMGWYRSERYFAIKEPHPQSFWPNINTPEDFDQLKRHLKQINQPS